MHILKTLVGILAISSQAWAVPVGPAAPMPPMAPAAGQIAFGVPQKSELRAGILYVVKQVPGGMRVEMSSDSMDKFMALGNARDVLQLEIPSKYPGQKVIELKLERVAGQGFHSLKLVKGWLNLPDLEVLNITNANLHSIESGAFAGTPRLKALAVLYKQDADVYKTPAGFGTTIGSQTKINVQVAPLESTTMLNAQNKTGVQIAPDAFSGLSLEKLFLSHPVIADAGMFHGITTLKELGLWGVDESVKVAVKTSMQAHPSCLKVQFDGNPAEAAGTCPVR